MGVDLGDEPAALRAEPVHRLLGLSDQVHQSGRVAAPDLVSAGDPVCGRQEHPGQQADERYTQPPAGGSARKLGMLGLRHTPLPRRILDLWPTYVNLVGDSRFIVAPMAPSVCEGNNAQVQGS